MRRSFSHHIVTRDDNSGNDDDVISIMMIIMFTLICHFFDWHTVIYLCCMKSLLLDVAGI